MFSLFQTYQYDFFAKNCINTFWYGFIIKPYIFIYRRKKHKVIKLLKSFYVRVNLYSSTIILNVGNENVDIKLSAIMV